MIEAVQSEWVKRLTLHAVILAITGAFQAKTDAVFSSIAIQQQHLIGADLQQADPLKMQNTEVTLQWP